VQIPAGLRYGRYLHYLESREQAALKRRATRVMRDLAGLHHRCPRCSGSGVISVVVRRGYTAADGTVVPAEYESRTCPRCKGKRRLFRSGVASAAYERYGAPDGAGEEAFMRQARLSGSSFLQQPPIRAVVEGTYGTVYGPRGDALFPLHFVLLPDGRDYEWFLGPDTPHELVMAPGEATVAGVAAADILLLDDGTIVRVCGLVVTDKRGRELPPDATATNETVRLAARALILGKRVKLTPDKYARMTCDGHPLVFVEVNGGDYGELLLRAGLVRRHTRHKHARNMRYQRAETEAKKAQRGIWAD
jgi:endonuclease YncB( thermonuclease family)